MKIVEVISDTNIGGAGILLANRLECTDLEKYHTTVFLPCGSRLAERLKAIGVECMELDCVGDRSWHFGDVKKYKDAIEKLKPDLINCHGCLSARVAAKWWGVPVKICTRHCVFPVKYRDKIFGLINNGLSDVFIAVANSAKQNLLELGVDESKIRVIINGAKALKKLSEHEKSYLRTRLGIKEADWVLVMCARLEKCKGHIFLLEALKILKSDGIRCIALIVGEGSEEAALKENCRRLDIEDMVRFTGFSNDVARYMNIAHININCSVGTETSSLALSEGMSLGIPAIVSDYGGNPYMIRHGENGLVYKTADSQELAKCIKKIMSDRELYEKMCCEAIKRFERELNCGVMTQKTNRLYDTLISECHRTDYKTL